MIGPVDAQTMAELTTEAVRRALAEDLDERGDVTAQLIDAEVAGSLRIIARHSGVVAGSACAIAAFTLVDHNLTVHWQCPDGTAFEAGTVIAEITGRFRSIVTAERTALNFLGHLSGIATMTAAFVTAVHAVAPNCQILDTRKTTPQLRVFEKAAVVAGGGTNHRFGLSDAVLIKDNHLGALSIGEAVARSKAIHPELEVEVECDRLDQALEAVAAAADAVLLDNMGPDEVRRCVEAIRAHGGTSTRIEVSGGVTLETAPLLAAAGPDCISVGALTHSSVVADFGLDLIRSNSAS